MSEVYPNGDNPLSPNHYNHWTIQPLEFIAKNGLDFLRGNVIKYIMRHNMKNGISDMEKAFVYMFQIVKNEYPAKAITEFIDEVKKTLDK